jgi:hypothetical protein
LGFSIAGFNIAGFNIAGVGIFANPQALQLPDPSPKERPAF